jgi:hypothetical protein
VVELTSGLGGRSGMKAHNIKSRVLSLSRKCSTLFKKAMSYVVLLRRFPVNYTMDDVESESSENMHCDVTIDYHLSEIPNVCVLLKINS